MPQIKKVTKEGDFYHVRYRNPSQFERIRTPDWAAGVARSESKGAEVRMGRTAAGTWLVQSVLIRRGGGKTKQDAMRLAGRVRRKIEDDE